MGPSQEFAFSQAEIALDEIKCLLMRKYHIEVFPDTGTDILAFGNFSEEQVDNFKVLDGLIKEIFWHDACMSF